MAFSPNSNNPRERRAFAHTKLSQLKQGKATYEEASGAVRAASHNRKGQASGFAESLGKIAVVLVDWSCTSFQRPGIVHHNFGGYVMPQSETDRWTALQNAISDRQAALGPRDFYDPDDPTLRELYIQNNQVHDQGYPTAVFTRIFKGEPALNDDAYPSPGSVINPVKIEDAIPFIGWNEDQAVEARIAELR